MADALAPHLRRAFEYEARCTPLTVADLASARVKVEQVGLASLAAPLERAIEIFCHIQAARRLWLSRVSDLTTFPPDGVFPVWPVEVAKREALELDQLWARFADTLTDEMLARPMQYTSTEGSAFASTLTDICTHVVNHSSYHRGQIAMLVAHAGIKPAVTDYIALTRAKR
ncbi:MAG: DinB family protein [Phycisphaerales bacterium]|nr:DinB family protein [Phycisphaerales bacterium]